MNANTDKPCPYCGKIPSVVTHISGLLPIAAPEGISVECRNPHCKIKPHTALYPTEDEAVEEWERMANMIDIENPMILNQEQHDKQMQDVNDLVHCDYCDRQFEREEVTEYGDLHICPKCEKAFLTDEAGKYVKDYTFIHLQDYLRYWLDNLPEGDLLCVLMDSYVDWKKNTDPDEIIKSQTEFCSDNEKDFLQYVKEQVKGEKR